MMTSETFPQIRSNYTEVMDRIRAAASQSRYAPGQVKLVAVSKFQTLEKIKTAIENGIKCFGENYPEEAEPKINALADLYPGIEWHMIGHLQSRKAAIVCQYFSLFHSLDSVHLAQKMDRILFSSGKKLPILLEVNVSGESSKSGWMAIDKQSRETLIPDFEKVISCRNLEISGLMCMPPLGKDKEQSRSYFINLRGLRDFLRINLPNTKWNELSMGTSFDFEVAIQEGATIVRIGEAIFGKRQ